jgi:HEAT repeat protein
VEIVAEYIRLVGDVGVEGFTDLLAEEQNRRVRVRMCEALIRLGSVAVPTLVSRASDPRWFMARNAVYTLGKIGAAAGIPAVTAAFENPHPRVRIEAVRAAYLLNVPGLTGLLLRRVSDKDLSVRRAVVASLRGPAMGVAIPSLVEVLVEPAEDEADWDLKNEAMNALVSIGTAEARSVLQDFARRRAWLWSRNERRLKSLAEQALVRFGSASARRRVNADE